MQTLNFRRRRCRGIDPYVLQSVSISTRRDVASKSLISWSDDIVQREGPNILRSKGILAFANEPKRFVFQGVHMILDGDVQRPWKSDEPRKSRIVFIGRNLNEDELRQGFLACAA